VSVKLRLTRMGAKKKPFYRIVAADSHRARDGRFIEILGHYDPAKYPESIVMKEDKVQAWIDKGAEPTLAVKKLLKVKSVARKANA
jgi:small subunit ribosomal protein S16